MMPGRWINAQNQGTATSTESRFYIDTLALRLALATPDGSVMRSERAYAKRRKAVESKPFLRKPYQ